MEASALPDHQALLCQVRAAAWYFAQWGCCVKLSNEVGLLHIPFFSTSDAMLQGWEDGCEGIASCNTVLGSGSVEPSQQNASAATYRLWKAP